MSTPIQQDGPYAAYDPLQDRPTPPALGPLLNEQGQPLPSFDRRYTEALDGLMFVGALSKTFDYLGHAFVIRTLFQGETLLVPLMMKPWQGSIGEAKAYTTGMASLCVLSIDGQPLPLPVGETAGDENGWAHQRFNYARTHWFPWVVDKIYSEYLTLEATANEVVTAMEKASGLTDSTAGSNADSAGPTDRDSSEAPGSP